MVLQNYVRLEAGVPKRLHFTSHALQEREIVDPLTRSVKTVRALVYTVDEVDGRPETTTFSVLAEKLAAMLAPYLPDSGYAAYDFIITQWGTGFQTRYELRVERRR